MLREDTRRILKNFFSLSLLEGVNYLLPLITLPYLVRVLGPTKFGMVAFAQAFTMYFVILADYGFYLYAPRIIALERENKERISKIFSTIMSIKFVFILFCLGVIILLVNVIGKLRIESTIFVYSCSMLFGDLLFPTWFFQGMERMQFITILYFVAKLFFLIAIFTMVKSQVHYVYVPLLNSAGLWLAGLISLMIIKFKFKIKYYIPGWCEISYHLREAWHFFLSTLSTSLYTNSSVVILGMVTSSTFVGYYSAAEKLVRAIQRILWAASQSIYPHVNRLALRSREQALAFLRKAFFIFGGAFLVVSAMIFAFSPVIIRIVLGQQYIASTYILHVLAAIPFLASIGNIFGLQTMLAFDLKQLYSRVMIAAAMVCVVTTLALSIYFRHVGAAFAAVFTEFFILTASFLILRNKKIYIFGRQ